MKWEDLFQSLLTKKSPDEIEDALRKCHAAGDFDDMSREELEGRILQMRCFAGLSPECTISTCTDGTAHGFRTRTFIKDSNNQTALCGKAVDVGEKDGNSLMCEECMPLIAQELGIPKAEFMKKMGEMKDGS
jgi:hypothetical protein